jgi:hypothetical protein
MWDFDEVTPVASIVVEVCSISPLLLHFLIFLPSQPYLPVQITDAIVEPPEAPVAQPRIAAAAQLVSLVNTTYLCAVLALGSAHTMLYEKALDVHAALLGGIPSLLAAFTSTYLVYRTEALSSYATLSTITHLILVALACVYHFAKRVFVCKHGATSIRHGANLVMLMVAGTWAVVFFAGFIAFVLTSAMFQLHDIAVALVYSYVHQRSLTNRFAHLTLFF